MEFAVIFDMDGVLIDSQKHIWKSFNQLAKPHGVIFTSEDVKKANGLSLRDIMVLWKKKYGIDFEIEKFSREAGKIEIGLMKKHLTTPKLVKELKKYGIVMGVGTSSMKWWAQEILRIIGVDKYISGLVTAEDTEYHKPHPGFFLEVAKRIGKEPYECVVVEDSVKGIESAKKGNMKAVGILNDQESGDFAKADLVVSNISDLSYSKLLEVLK